MYSHDHDVRNLPDVVRLTSRKQFLAMKRHDSVVVMPGFVLQYAKASDVASDISLECTQRAVGFTVTKKLGNAPKRNHARRRLREMVRLVFPEHAPQGYAFVLIGRHRLPAMPFDVLVQQGRDALRKISST